jgi:hypothetical protein
MHDAASRRQGWKRRGKQAVVTAIPAQADVGRTPILAMLATPPAQKRRACSTNRGRRADDDPRGAAGPDSGTLALELTARFAGLNLFERLAQLPTK